MSVKLGRDARICILGAGAAGLSTAWYLRKHGYHRVTILERESQIGGKCVSMAHQGVTLDLGAALLMPDYTRVLAMAAEVGAQTCELPTFAAIQTTGGKFKTRSISQLIFEKHGLVEFLAAAWRYLAAHRRHSVTLKRPGFAGMSAMTNPGEDRADLSAPFGMWAREQRLEPLLTQFQLPFEAFGYGDVGRLPTAYVLRYISARLFLTMTLAPALSRAGIHWPRRFTHGFGEFWNRIARGFHIRLNARIETIRRDNKVSIVWTESNGERTLRSSETFDTLVIACPPAATDGVMEWSRVESRLVRKVRNERYSVTVCETTGIPKTISFLETPGGPGHLIQLWKPADGPGVCAFYTSPAKGMAASDVIALVRQDVGRIYPDGNVGEVITHVDWPYFPHVDTETFAAGFFEDFEAIQGENATWYCGSLLAFESVENVVAYSENLVDRLIRTVDPARRLNNNHGISVTENSAPDSARVF